MRYNKVEYIAAADVYCTTHSVKVPFCMLEYFSSKIMNDCLHVDNNNGELDIVYDMIIGHELMVQLGLMDDFKRQILQLNGITLHMKDPRIFLGKSNLTKRKMRKVVMQTAEPASKREATK